uniref:type IV secretion system protein n=1 Tax=Methylomonas sp. SPW-1 TaxID=3438877 RepID=UPI00402BB955
MKSISKKLIVSAIALMLSENNANAIDIVNDPAHMAETIAGWAANHQDEINQLNNLVQQLQQLQQTYQMVTSTYNSMTGNRGFGSVLPLTNLARNYLPANTGDMLDVINGASVTYNNMSGMVQNFTNQNAVLSPGALANLHMTASQLQQFTAQRKNIATVQATATQSMDAASNRFNYIQQLMNEVSHTNDPKGIAELQARIAGEQTMLQNDQTKMQQMYAYLQNQDQLIRQQNREMAIQQVGHTGNLVQPNLSIMSP